MSVARKMVSEDKPGKLPRHVPRETGGLAGFADGGGLAGSPPPAPWFERAEAREINMPHGGFLNSGIAGRTDRIPASVAADSFVMPADVVSGLGQGNSLAGGRILSQALKMGPWGTELPAHSHGPGPPRAPAPHVFGEGGQTKEAKVLLAGGEFSIPPDFVAQIGGGNLQKGHAMLRNVVAVVRKFARRPLPPPKRKRGGHVPLQSGGLAPDAAQDNPFENLDQWRFLLGPSYKEGQLLPMTPAQERTHGAAGWEREQAGTSRRDDPLANAVTFAKFYRPDQNI